MMRHADLKRLNILRREKQFAFTLHCLTDDHTSVYTLDDAIPPFIREAAGKTLKTGRGFSFACDGRDFFINPYIPLPGIVITGAVHIAQTLAPMAIACGYGVHIIDPREAFASAERFPGCPVTAEWPDKYFSRHPVHCFEALVALTHNPDIDDQAIIHAIRQKAFYVGALGSRKTHARRVERLLQRGLSERQIAAIHAPVGLDIAAVTPEEIAVSILSQIIQCWRKGDHRGSCEN